MRSAAPSIAPGRDLPPGLSARLSGSPSDSGRPDPGIRACSMAMTRLLASGISASRVWKCSVSNRRRLHGLVGDHGGRTGAVVDQRHLSHHRPGMQRDDVLAPDQHAGVALDDHVAVLPDATLLTQHRARLGVDLLGQLDHAGQLVLGESIEERHLGEPLGNGLMLAVCAMRSLPLGAAHRRRPPCRPQLRFAQRARAGAAGSRPGGPRRSTGSPLSVPPSITRRSLPRRGRGPDRPKRPEGHRTGWRWTRPAGPPRSPGAAPAGDRDSGRRGRTGSPPRSQSRPSARRSTMVSGPGQ